MVITVLNGVLFHVSGLRRLCYDIEMMQGYGPNIWFKICWCGITPVILTVSEKASFSCGSFVLDSIQTGWEKKLKTLNGEQPTVESPPPPPPPARSSSFFFFPSFFSFFLE